MRGAPLRHGGGVDGLVARGAGELAAGLRAAVEVHLGATGRQSSEALPPASRGGGAHSELEAEGMDAVTEGLEPAREGGAGSELAVHALLGQVAVAARAAAPSAAVGWGWRGERGPLEVDVFVADVSQARLDDGLRNTDDRVLVQPGAAVVHAALVPAQLRSGASSGEEWVRGGGQDCLFQEDQPRCGVRDRPFSSPMAAGNASRRSLISVEWQSVG